MSKLSKLMDRMTVTLYKLEASLLNKHANSAAKRSDKLSKRAMKLAEVSAEKRRDAEQVLSKVAQMEGATE